MTKDGKSRSIAMKLSVLARARKIPFEKLQTEFLIERMLARLVNSKTLASAFIFKGGYVGRRAYGSPRYTIDLDALLRTGRISSMQKSIIEAIEKDIKDGVWFKFEETQDLQTQGEYPGIRFVFRTGIGQQDGDLKRAQIVSFDVGVGDFAEPVELELTGIIDEESLSWNVYSREVIVAEKLHSCLSRPIGNSRAKDIFDLLYYLPDCNPEELRRSVHETFKSRSDALPKDIISKFDALRTDTLRMGWRSATLNIEEAGTFDDAFAGVLLILKKYF